MAWKIREDGKFDTGRKQKIDEDIIDKLYQAFSIGCNDEQACEFADIHPSTMYNYQTKHKEFKEWKEGLKIKPILKAKNTVVKNLDDPKIAFEYLKHKCPDEFKTKVENDTTIKGLEIALVKWK